MGSRKNYKTRNTLKKKFKKRIHGGGENKDEVILKIEQHKIENVEIILFLIDFLNKPELKNIVLVNFKFINGIDLENNASQTFNFTTNPEFRKLVDDVIQWFLLDYNKQFANSILGIITPFLI